MAQDFLLELGTEELPDRELNILSQALETAFIAQLNTYALSFSSTKRFATPRRLALFVSNVSMQQPVQQHNRKGPALSIAFQDGKPTTALKKFAQACHVSWEELTPVTSEKGTWMTYQATTPGQSTYDLLPSMIQKACDQLPLSKKMKWGAHLHEFLRPIHWIIALFDQTIIPIQLWNIQAHNKTQGHRIHCHQDLIIDHPSQYERLLTEKGFVIPDFHARKQTILHLINTILMPEMRPNLEPTLLDTITGLTEWPVPILGQFDQHFLSIPKPVLIAAIEDQQKCLTIIDKKDQLMPYFIAVANLASSHPIEVIAGYERVIRSRLSDAQFFYEQDQRSTLLDKRQKLQDIIFQNKLGSIYNKTERLAAWMTQVYATENCPDLQVYSLDDIHLASYLTKSDLTTKLVLEFPQLQGIAGRQYAQLDQLPSEVCQAIEEHYWPKFSGDQLPNTSLSAYLALADKWDTLVGLFSVNQIPSGNKDPFGLRRAALGILRIMIHHKIPITVLQCATFAASNYTNQQNITIDSNRLDQIIYFMMERFAYWLQEQGIALNTFQAVIEIQDQNMTPYDMMRRIEALEAFKKTSDAEAMIQMHKRIQNLLLNTEETNRSFNAKILNQIEEKSLLETMQKQTQLLQPLLSHQHYSDALLALIPLLEPTTQFFQHVLVNSEDETERLNRYELLHDLNQMFNSIGCLSKLA